MRGDMILVVGILVLCSCQIIDARQSQHALNPALLEIQHAARHHQQQGEQAQTQAKAQAQADGQFQVQVGKDPVKPINTATAGLGLMTMKKGTTLRTVMPFDPTDQSLVRDVPTFFKYPGGTDPSGQYCGANKFLTTWETVDDLKLVVQAGSMAEILQPKEVKDILTVTRQERDYFLWRAALANNHNNAPTDCDLGADACMDVDPKTKLTAEQFNDDAAKEGTRIFEKAKASCHQMFGLVKAPDMAKDKYKYLCNTNFPPGLFNKGLSYAAPLLFGEDGLDGYIRETEVVLYGYPSTIDSKWYSPRSWLKKVKLIKTEPCPSK